VASTSTSTSTTCTSLLYDTIYKGQWVMLMQRQWSFEDFWIERCECNKVIELYYSNFSLPNVILGLSAVPIRCTAASPGEHTHTSFCRFWTHATNSADPQRMWARRSGKISRSSLSSIYGSPSHRSVPAPTTSRSAPLIWLLDPLRSLSAPAPQQGGI